MVSSTSAQAPEILIIGDSSGKSLLVQRLQSLRASAAERLALPSETIPTTGVRLDDVTVGSGRVTLREVGSPLRPTWPAYFLAAAGVVVSDGMGARLISASAGATAPELAHHSGILSAMPLA